MPVNEVEKRGISLFQLIAVLITLSQLSLATLSAKDRLPQLVSNEINTTGFLLEPVKDLGLYASPEQTEDANDPLLLLKESMGDSNYLLVEFFLIKCSGCLYNWPLLIDLDELLREDDVRTLAINIDRNEVMAKNFMIENYPELQFDVLYDPERRLAFEFMVFATPVTVLLKRGALDQFNGLWRHSGPFNEQTLGEIRQAIYDDQMLLEEGNDNATDD